MKLSIPQMLAELRVAKAIVEATEAKLELLAEVLDEEPEEGTPEECPHTNRRNIGRIGDPNRWKCRDCGYDSANQGQGNG